MTFQDALTEGSRILKRHRCSPHAAREAEELLCFAARVPRETPLTHPERRVSPAAERKFKDALRRRLRHEPVECITGQASFFGRTFKVTKDTLIPRPATETLIEAALVEAEKRKSLKAEKFIDVGTGSGAIAITLALEFPDSTVIATDTSTKTLRIAKANAKRHGVSSRIRFVKTDLLPAQSLNRSVAQPLTIIANLPYIPSAAMKKLPPDVRLHEPRQALDGGKDGLTYYNRLLMSPPLRLFASSQLRLFFEILPDQYAPLAKLAKKTLPGSRTEKVRNLAGITIGIRISH